MSGFLTARVLVDYYANVTIVEADTSLDIYGSRVGQRSQLHAMLAVGRVVLIAMFPGFDNEAKAAGGLSAPFHQ